MAASLTQLVDLRPGDKNVHARLVVIERLGGAAAPPTATRDGHVISAFRAADETAAVELAVWDRPGLVFAPGDVIALRDGYASLFRGRLCLYVGARGVVRRLGREPAPFTLSPDMSSRHVSWAHDDASGRWQPTTGCAEVARAGAAGVPLATPPAAQPPGPPRGGGEGPSPTDVRGNGTRLTVS
jgi:hypothetical protein